MQIHEFSTTFSSDIEHSFVSLSGRVLPIFSETKIRKLNVNEKYKQIRQKNHYEHFPTENRVFQCHPFI